MKAIPWRSAPTALRCQATNRGPAMYKRLRNLFYVGVAVILVAGFVRFRMQSPVAAAAGAGAAAQQTATIDKGDVTLTTNATGPLSARQQVNVSFLTQGRVVLLNVQEGDHVRKGQTIAVLDTTDLQDAVNQAQANLNLQQINLRTLTDKPRAAD